MCGAKIVKGERRIKYRNLFQIFFIPNRILSYLKIVKGERRIKYRNLFQYFLSRTASYLPGKNRAKTFSHSLHNVSAPKVSYIGFFITFACRNRTKVDWDSGTEIPLYQARQSACFNRQGGAINALLQSCRSSLKTAL